MRPRALVILAGAGCLLAALFWTLLSLGAVPRVVGVVLVLAALTVAGASAALLARLTLRSIARLRRVNATLRTRLEGLEATVREERARVAEMAAETRAAHSSLQQDLQEQRQESGDRQHIADEKGRLQRIWLEALQGTGTRTREQVAAIEGRLDRLDRDTAPSITVAVHDQVDGLPQDASVHIIELRRDVGSLRDELGREIGRLEELLIRRDRQRQPQAVEDADSTTHQPSS